MGAVQLGAIKIFQKSKFYVTIAEFLYKSTSVFLEGENLLCTLTFKLRKKN